MATRSLLVIKRTSLGRMARLLDIAKSLPPYSQNFDHAIRQSYGRDLLFVSIEATNCWRNFLRSYFLSSALTGFTTSNTSVAADHSLSTETDAMTLAIRTLRPGLATKNPPWDYHQEPDWLSSGNVARLLADLACSHSSDFNSAISLGGSSRQELTIFRNFMAHRNEDTARKMRNLAQTLLVRGDIDPSLIPLQQKRGRDTILTEWIAELEIIISLVPT